MRGKVNIFPACIWTFLIRASPKNTQMPAQDERVVSTSELCLIGFVFICYSNMFDAIVRRHVILKEASHNFLLTQCWTYAMVVFQTTALVHAQWSVFGCFECCNRMLIGLNIRIVSSQLCLYFGQDFGPPLLSLSLFSWNSEPWIIERTSTDVNCPAAEKS